MEEHHATAEDDERPGFKQDPVTGNLGLALGRAWLGLQVSCPVIIDGLCGDRQHRDRRQQGEKRHQQENRALREGVTNRAGHQGDPDIAGMVEGRVPAHPPRQLLPRVEAQGQGRDRRTEDIAGDSHKAIGDQHRPEDRPGEDDQGGERQHGEREDEHSSLGAGFVDCSADRGLNGNPAEAADHGYEPNMGLAPLLLGDEEDIEIRPDRAADVGREEIQCIEGKGVKAVCAGTGVGRSGARYCEMFCRRRSFH
jgi:hypothetical protein